MRRAITLYKEPIHRSEIKDPIDDVRVGDWYWVDYEDYRDGERKKVTELFCVNHIGSNHIGLTHAYGDGGSRTVKLLFDEFEKDCRREENWKEIFDLLILDIQRQIKEKTNKLVNAGRELHLLRIEREENYNDTFLPSVELIDPNKYKSDLVKFQTETVPQIQEEIKALSVKYARVMKDLNLSDMSRFGLAEKAIRKVKDRIFTIEIYAGIQELIKQIAKGKKAKVDEQITIRQQLLYMDEECLIDFDKGGMDFEKIEDFDRWIVRPENLSRILPEQKSIVAFRVRRKEKDYGIPASLFEVFRNIEKDYANRETYLLIRNGENVYRIFSQADFSPRLIPFKNEIGEKQFLKFDSWHREKPPRKITPDDIEYDEHVGEMDRLIKKYNRIFILLQGLLDRSHVFHPHPGIRLDNSNSIGLWINCIRDEEEGLPNNTVTFDEYRDQLNRTLKKGDLAWSRWVPEEFGRCECWDHRDRIVYTAREWQVKDRPLVCRVKGISKGRSHVWITWETDVYSWHRQSDTINRHLKVPMEEVFNVSDYNKGDYRMFLCDRALQGKYLEWAEPLLTAEKKGKSNDKNS